MLKQTFTALVVFALLSIAMQATGQQTQAVHQRRGQIPYASTDKSNYQVWIDMNALHYWMPQERRAADLSPYSTQSWNTQLAGAWGAATLPGLVLTLQSDGSFSLATPANPDKLCSAGTERGNWYVMDETSQLFFRIKTDTSGTCGFSDLHATMTIRVTDSGLLLLTNEPASGVQEIPLVRL